MNDPVIGRAAAGWVARQDRGLSAGEAADLDAWVRADARHQAAFAEAGGAWRNLDHLRGVADLEAMADAVVTRARLRQARRRSRRRAVFALGAAAVIALGGFGWQKLKPVQGEMAASLPESVRVLASTLRAQTLADGSVAELNGDSRIEVDYSASERRVRLVSGEAHFVVAKNPGRPFFVSVGPVTVRAVGTAFNIRHSPAAIEVLVTEGTVRVEPAQPASSSRNEAVSGPGPALVAGQRALIEQNSESSSVIDVSEVGRSEIEEVMAWQGTRLVFSSTRLDEVVAAFNRYNRHRLTLGDPRLRERTLTGTFRADNLEGFLRLVRQMVDVKAEKRTAGETVLLPAT